MQKEVIPPSRPMQNTNPYSPVISIDNKILVNFKLTKF